MTESQIEHNLSSYVDRIEKEIELGNFRTTKTEDFFLRVLSATYNLTNLENLAYDKINTIAIDLIDRERNLGIQVTAQKSNEKTKIDDTITDTISVWKDKGINTLWILFISETAYIKKNIDTTQLYLEKDGLKVYIKTVRRLIGDINKRPIEERIKIDELLKQETSTEYGGLSRLTNFKILNKGEKIVNDLFFNLEETIYYSKKELATINFLADSFSNGKLKEYCILGNPCSGKTTFAYSIIQKIHKRKIFYLNLSNPSIIASQVIEELIQISHNYSFVVIDNIHDNIKLYLIIRERILKSKWINSLYLTRYYKTFDEFNIENIYRLIEEMNYFRIDTNENFEEKVSGIIWKKTKFLKDKGSQLEWLKGDFEKILKNTNRNLLKLNIALRMWELKNSQANSITFDEIDSNKILEQFFAEHNLSEIKSDALYTYCLLFKNDIPFIPSKGAYKENSLLREKGIILQYFQSDFCFFPHKEYAQLIFDAFNYIENGISSAKKISLIQNYIHNFDTTENKIGFRFILSKLHYSEDKEILGELLNDEITSSILKKEIGDSDTTISQVIASLNIIFIHSEKIAKERLEEFYKTFLTFFNKNKLSLFLEDHYLAYTRLLQICNQLNKELKDEFVTVVLKENEKANTNSIVELTLRVSRKNRESQTILRILNSFTFPKWLQMIVDLPRLPNITNSLSELNTSSEAKKLLTGLFRNIDWKKEYENAKVLKIDQFVKSLREINRIDNSIGTNISRLFFKSALNDSLFTIKLESANLSEYSKALSDLSKINSDYAKHKLADDLKSNIVFKKFSDEPSISNFTARALELRKLFEDSKAYFSVLNKIVLSESFIRRIQTETNLNYLLIFTEFAEKYLNFEKSILKQETSIAITNVIAKLPNKLEALSNPKFLNVENLDSDFIDSLSTREIENYFESNKITYAEDLFRVLSTIDKEKTIEKFKKLNNAVLVRALLNPELNFSQAIENINKLKNKVYKDEKLNSNKKIAEILNDYLLKYTNDNRRYSRISVSDYFKGYYFGLCIDQLTIEKNCKSDFENKLKSNEHKNFEIASLFQFVRRLSEITNNQHDKELAEFLKSNTDNFIEVIKNEEITKTLSGLCELALTNFDDYADELLFKSRKWIIKKAEQRNRQEIYRVKILPDIEKIAKDKGKVVLKELRK
ncbi:SMEK domain-containing protein [Flavobacterium sp. ZT3R18]|uniref:SMEK domain-containing protein n=1 Tax=Flavobacterium sp. ZT3R18 TaxID=2594429 RepID=UPI00117A83C6|nr:SMEK domain-containing protein [Flavobacterium sp. ZT3R18]TRX35852.1 SMEK domain-containing protein [Flavobacterium sp. ZT3R18]